MGDHPWTMTFTALPFRGETDWPDISRGTPLRLPCSKCGATAQIHTLASITLLDVFLVPNLILTMILIISVLLGSVLPGSE